MENQKYYKDGFMNPGTIMAIYYDDQGKQTSNKTSSYTPKVMIRKSTMTQKYPPELDENKDAVIHVNVDAQFPVAGFVTSMFAQSDMPKYIIPANQQLVNGCYGIAALKINAAAGTYKDAQDADRTYSNYNLSLLKNYFATIKNTNIPALANTIECNKQNCVAPTTATYSKWYDCVKNTYRNYWRPYYEEYTGFKRGERIIAITKKVFTLEPNTDNSATIAQMQALIDAGVLKLDKKQNLDKLLSWVGYSSEDGIAQKTEISIQANIFIDYDIGLDIWTVIVTVILFVISLWFIITVKCVPSFGKKIYKCCPSLFEVETVDKQSKKVNDNEQLVAKDNVEMK